MYSWEINQKIKDFNYNIPSSVYIEISDVNKNSQIGHIEYNSWSNSFTIWTKDGWNWNFKVYKD